MKKIFIFFILIILCSCSTMKIKAPKDFVYKEIKTDDYVLASWQKIRDKDSLVKIYIEENVIVHKTCYT